jgi:hypothetical protein
MTVKHGIYAKEYYLAFEEDNMDSHGGCYHKWNKSHLEREILYDLTCSRIWKCLIHRNGAEL